jgi:hypothetical protein
MCPLHEDDKNEAKLVLYPHVSADFAEMWPPPESYWLFNFSPYRSEAMADFYEDQVDIIL